MPSSWSDEKVVASGDEAAHDAYYARKSVVVNPPGPRIYGKKSVVAGKRYHYPEDTTAKTPSEEDPSEDEQLLLPSYRVVFRYPFAGGFRYGWRYPLSYWNVYGGRFYPATCGFGRVFGSYYYC